MLTRKSFELEGSGSKPILTEVFYQATNTLKPVVILCLGYLGYKDWGAWKLIAKKFAEKDFFFITFNYSHSGVTPKNPSEITDLETLSENNFSRESADIEQVVHWITTTKEFASEANVLKVYLLGHSRGGGLALLKASNNSHIKAVATWAGISDFETYIPKGNELKKWKEKGIFHVELPGFPFKIPHKIQFYEDYLKQKEDLNIRKAVRYLRLPLFFAQAMDDKVVKPEVARKLHRWNLKSQLYFIREGGHNFGVKHPFHKTELPEPLQKIINKTIAFFNDL